MTVELKVAVAGKGYFYPPGIHKMPDSIAESLLKAGHATKKKASGGTSGSTSRKKESEKE